MSVRMKKKTRVRNIALALFLTLVFVLGAEQSWTSKTQLKND